MSETSEKQKVQQFLRSLIVARNLPLMLLGITTLAFVWPSSRDWATDQFGQNTWSALFAANLLTIIIYGSVDGVLELTLKFIDGTRVPKNGRLFYYAVCVLGLSALIASGTFSMWASPIVSEAFRKDTGGTEKTKELLEREYTIQEKQIESNQAAIQAAIDSAPTRIAAAQAEAQKIELDAVNSTTHGSWKKDYYAARNNPQHWFWTCEGGSGCPSGYRAYRDQVAQARAEGKALISAEKNLVAKLQGTSPTLASTGSFQIIRQLSHTDSLETSHQLYLSARRADAIIMVEWICLFLVGAITIIVLAGRKAYDIDLDIKPVTLFGAVEMLIMKVSNTLFALYKEAVDYINPDTIKAGFMIPVVAAGNYLGGTTKRLHQELQEKAEAAEIARQQAESARQEAERQRREMEAQARQEAERQRAADYERRRRQAEEEARQREQAERQERERQEAAARQKAEEERQERLRQDKERRQSEADKATKEADKTPKPLSDKRRRYTTDRFVVYLSEEEGIVAEFGEKERHTWPLHELSDFLDLSKKWYARQFSSAQEKTRQKNADKWTAVRAFLIDNGLKPSNITELPTKVEIDAKQLFETIHS